MNWTKEQREAIEHKGENILLAAAAGSGKTAVLVQRIIEKILDSESPIDVNELLVLTFTDAAATEMKHKISDAINSELRKNPSNKHLRKQSLLITSASVSTIHSFCLDTIKNNIHLTTLPIDFSIIPETENQILKVQALDEILEKYYSKIDKLASFKSLAVGYGGIKNDSGLREIILSLHKFSKSMPYPKKWLNNSVNMYKNVTKTKSISGSLWESSILYEISNIVSNLSSIYTDTIIYVKDHLPLDHPYVAFFSNENLSVSQLCSCVTIAIENHPEDVLDEIRNLVLNFSFKTIRGQRKADEITKSYEEKAKNYREYAKTEINKLKDLLFAPTADMVERISLTYPQLRTLKNIVIMMDKKYTKAKRLKGYLDFNDLEHEMIKLVSDSNGNPTAIACNLREKYAEILVDEYQDTNNIQDTIFKLISRDNKNIFMVGDMKQSIYKFRNAVPALFLDKYHTYAKDTEDGHLIKLFKNFRSRKTVVDFINFIFENIMSEKIGDVKYDKSEYLIQGAAYPEPENPNLLDTELYMIDTCLNEDTNDIDKTEIEARIIARRIKKLVLEDKIRIFNSKLSQLRDIKYSDIVILMRNTRKVEPIYETVFNEESVPLYTESGRSYLNTIEVQTALSFLQVIDNPYQDIPLIALMKSPIWGFTSDELAEIRSIKRSGNFYEAVLEYAKTGNKKTLEFVSKISSLRLDAEHTGVDELIFRIYNEFNYYSIVSAMSNGNIRQANLRLLFERASDFEKSKLSGLFNFMNYIETIKDGGQDLTPAKVLNENDNVVKIMTIHKSKGLEFPVVFLANTLNAFNTTDLKKSIMWHERLGFGLDYVDGDMRTKYPSITKKILAGEAKREMMSEEMRLLYVALTRAKEKIIITAPFGDRDNNWQKSSYSCNGKVIKPYIENSRYLRDWLVAPILRHKNSDNLRKLCQLDQNIIDINADFGFGVYLVKYNDILNKPYEVHVCEDESSAIDYKEQALSIQDRLRFRYPYDELGKIPVKMSVSEVKRREMPEYDYIPPIKDLLDSSFIDTSEIHGKERGTLMHYILQHINEDNTGSLADINLQISDMVLKGTISKEQQKIVDPNQIYNFFNSDLGQRLKRSKNKKKEFKFYTHINAEELYPGLKCSSFEDEKILLQGIVDCLFEEDDELIIIDYKTDKIDSFNTLDYANKYRIQLKYYAKGIEEIFKKPVKTKYLYFLSSSRLVEI